MPDGGFNVLFFSAPAAGVTFCPGRCSSASTRRTRLPRFAFVTRRQHRAEQESASLFDRLKEFAGAPEKLTPHGPGLGTPAEVAARHPLSLERRSDVDDLSAGRQHDRGNAARLHGRRSEGSGAAPLEFCSRGVKDCELGDKRMDVLNRWKITKPTLVNGALVLAPADGPFDTLLVILRAGRRGSAYRFRAVSQKAPGTDPAPPLSRNGKRTSIISVPCGVEKPS